MNLAKLAEYSIEANPLACIVVQRSILIPVAIMPSLTHVHFMVINAPAKFQLIRTLRK